MIISNKNYNKNAIITNHEQQEQQQQQHDITLCASVCALCVFMRVCACPTFSSIFALCLAEKAAIN